MRRGKGHDILEYIDIRINQLTEDMKKAKDDYDKQWYNRIIQELSWARSQNHNCYMDEVSHWKEKYGKVGVKNESR